MLLRPRGELGKTSGTGIKGPPGRLFGFVPGPRRGFLLKTRVIDMRIVLALIAILYSAAAFAQDKPPPAVGGKPLAQVISRTTSVKHGKQQPVAYRLQAIH